MTVLKALAASTFRVDASSLLRSVIEGCGYRLARWASSGRRDFCSTRGSLCRPAKTISDSFTFLSSFYGVREIKRALWTRRYGVMDVKYIQIPEGAPTLELGEEIELGEETEEIPEFFDARQKWPECISIGWIRDQSNCGSCWAVAAAEVASDRMCINPPYYSMMLSSEDILSCCGRQCYQQEACRGGYPFAAMNWWKTNGIVTGTEYTDHQGCRPSMPSYPRDYTQDKYFAEEAYYVPGDVTTIQREILAHGPVEAAFRLFQDFYHVGKRIYHGQVPYWLAVNSWGAGWGDQGLFRILRGNNECGFEDGIVAALPRS
ncbi:unnamed protein product, partial [Mesorhabditis belari]|uniref:Peptidase C1A papain C-terminal domain-containing protein n=1 Tax=Mesorhabditis belari TaxID=2138241 RepID=A0AAF3FB77_9BILA